MGYTKSALSGFSWHSFLKAATMAVVLLKISILARLLSPEAFGLFSLAMIALGIIEAVTETGINITIINAKQSVSYFLNTAWVISIIRGFVMGILMVLLGIFMSNYYDEPQLLLLVTIAATVPVIKGFINPAVISMQKELKFFKDSSYRFSLIAVEAAMAIVFGLILQSVFALILGLIVAAVFEVVISFVFFKEKPIFRFIPSRARVIINNAKGLTISAALSYLHENVDDFILGKLTGTFNLGLYHNAYSLSHKANFELAKAAQHSTFPVYSKISSDPPRLKRAFVKSIIATVFFVLITSLPLFLFPEFFVNLVLGDQWLAIVPLVRWLLLAGIIQGVAIIFYNVLYAKRVYFMVNAHLFTTIALLIILILMLTPTLGITGGAMAVAISRAVTFPLLVFGTVKILKS